MMNLEDILYFVFMEEQEQEKTNVNEKMISSQEEPRKRGI